jgi:hypothetical protein
MGAENNIVAFCPFLRAFHTFNSFHIVVIKTDATRHHSEFSLSTIVIDARDALMINEERC